MTEADREGEQSSNWKFAAMVVDRLCLYIFSFLMIGTVVGVCVSAPYIIA
nr:unnamed protein product [Meloidogyne enterolobii]